LTLNFLLALIIHKQSPAEILLFESYSVLSLPFAQQNYSFSALSGHGQFLMNFQCSSQSIEKKKKVQNKDKMADQKIPIFAQIHF
jgi:hypothetical protein